MSTTRAAATRSFGVAAFALGVLFAQPNLGPTPAVAASTMPAAVVSSVVSAQNPQASQDAKQPAIPESNPYSDATQCVYRAWDLAAEHGHKLPHFGNAADWKQGAIDAGYTVSDKLTPDCVDSVAVWDSGVGGTGWAGHVAWVTEVRDGEFHVQERNWVRATDTDRWVTWEPGISFILFPKDAPPPATAGANQPVALRPLGAALSSSALANQPALSRRNLLQAPALNEISPSGRADLWPSNPSAVAQPAPGS